MTVQVNVTEPLAPVLSWPVTVTLAVSAVVGVLLTRPAELIDRPLGRPVAV